MDRAVARAGHHQPPHPLIDQCLNHERARASVTHDNLDTGPGCYFFNSYRRNTSIRNRPIP